jgi:phosphoadenosine phosphosulfate reductase
MLIASCRHRKEDRELWRNLEVMDRANYHLRKVAAKAEAALEVIRQFVAAGPVYAALSFGKDSTILAHLLWLLSREGVSVPAFRVRMDGIETPGTDEVEAEFLKRFPLDYRRVESPHDPEEERIDGDREPALVRGIAMCQSLAGTKRYINGIRAGESAIRRSRVKKGLALENSCSPIGHWQDSDVFAYLAHHDLPVHPNYAMTLGGLFQREKLRVCMLGNHKGRQYGRLLWEKTYYPDVLKAMTQRNQNMVPR